MRQVTRRRSGSRSAGSGTETDDRRLPASRRRGRDPVNGEDSQDHPGGTEESASRSRRTASRENPAPTSGGRGWASHHRNASKAKRGFGASPDEFRVAEEDVQYLVKPLEDEPFWSYCEHFLNEIEDGKRSFTCGGEECPLCSYGDIPRAYDLFNVAAWDPDENGGDGGWVQKWWRATPDPATKILARSEELAGRKNPQALGDDDVYLIVSKSKTGKRKGGRSFNEFQVDLVKERDLEDYDADPLDPGESDDFLDNLFDEAVIPQASLKELRTAAEALDE